MSDINSQLQQALLLHQSGQLDKSAKIYEDVLNAAPNHPDALHLLGVIAYQSGRYEEAEDKIRKAIEFAPQNSSYYLNLGATLKSSGKLDEAISAYEQAIRLNPNLYEPYYNLAISLNDAGRTDESVLNYRKALQICPDSSNALSNLVYLLQRLCRWDELCVLYSEIEQSTRNDILSGRKPVEMPPVSLIRHDDPALVFAVAKAWANEWKVQSAKCKKNLTHNTSHITLKIGYVSGDFRNHPVASQMLSMFGLHDRSEFSVYCYSYGAEDGSYQRAKIRESCDHFIDISRLNDMEAAQRINQDGVDILVDLGGHTKGSRLNIFAYRPAPIQVSWLGFPATTGAGFMDYIITDKTVSPPEHASYYSEKFIYLPHTYMVNPYLQPISDRKFARSDFGLPEPTPAPSQEGNIFVFCSFNHSYKIEPLMFDVWMRILANVPDSVLWLRRVNTDGEKILKAEAKKRGINGQRLIFSDKLASKAEHLSRLALADLALDTRIYNGHATSNDALWAGLPVITLEGGHFASRACSSFLKAVGLSELITHSLKEYESLAVGLAHQPEKLTRIHQKLAKNRLTAPLFNTPNFVKNLEKAFRQMRALHISGRQPEHITVEDTLNMDIINMDIPVYTSLNVEAAMQKAIAYHQSNEREKAEDIYRQILAAYPDHPDALQLSGVAAYQRGEYDEAVRLINKAIHIKPADPSYYSNLGVTLKSQNKLDEAVEAFQKALELNPDYPEASFNLGLSFQEQGKTDEALACYQKALSLNPEYAEAHNNMGNIFRNQERTEEAVAAYLNAIRINPEYAEAHSSLLFQAQLGCEWKIVGQTAAKLAEMSRQHLEKREKTPETPFSTLTMYINPARSLEIAASWCREIARSVSSLTPFEHKKTAKSILTIGYLSADFCHHPVAHQILSLFGLHDRQKFKVFAYSTGPDDKSYYRHRIQQDCDQFADVSQLSPADIAKRIYDDGVDILVDLMGHTRHSRLEIFALRPAPIQVTWLGFPGTTGAEFIDYIIADKTIAPPEHAPYFSERLIYMPHAYMINDHHQPIIDKDWKRAEFGLAPDVFVFSSANKTYKIEPVMFDVWMNILRQVPNSVLWLRWVSDLAERNLKSEAQKRGISGDRLISSQKTPLKGEHLTRLKFADLALDTRIYNGHATTIDALWAGLPVLTLEGGHFASRACSSFLKAIGLPEMITHSLQEYESLAIALAQQPERLVRIRQKLSKHRITAPLFNTPGFVRDLEHGYQQIWQIFAAGESPRPIEVKSSENVEVLSDVAIHQELVQAIHLHEAGNTDAAAAIYAKVLENFPNHADALHLYGVTAYQRGRYEQATSLIRKAIANFPTNPLYYNNLGLVLKDMNHIQGAIEAFQKAVQFKPDYAEPLFNLGILLRRQGKSQDAIACYEKFLAITPDHAEAYYNMGVAYQSMEQFIHAISCYRKVIGINPNHAKALNNLGSCLKDRGNTGEAFACFQKAAQLEENPETYFNLGNIYKIRFMLQDAIACYRKVLQLKPDYAEAYANLFEQFQHVCDWKSPEGMGDQLDRLNQMAFDGGTKTPETPFLNISRQDDPAKNLAVAKSWKSPLPPFNKGGKNPFKKGEKIIIGYVSDNFYNHPVAHLMLGLFGLHDRSRFRVICYSTCKDDDSVYQRRIRQDSDAFENIRELNDAEAAQKIRDDGVDILVDLMGHTLHGRMGIFALRPAPVQLTWLGFPGTTGADCFDYLIADKIVAPQEHAAHYSEKLLHLPNCYQINDHRQAIAEKNLNRADFGLPDNGIVFCSFNQHFKIDPLMFDVWMNILKQVPDSVLWLIKRNELAPQNLKREAQNRGVNPDRLIFAENLPKDEHLARHGLADLALDTRIYNGHTTTSDALWAGVPAAGLLGNHFASRVSGSLLSAIELPELIARNLPEYEAIVLKLAQNPNELNRIRQKLAKNRLTAPLFDTPRFVKDLEGAYQWMLGTEEEQWYALGVSAYQQKKYAQAEDMFRRAISHSPNNFEYHTSLAAMLIEQGKFEDAAICCQKAIMLKSDHLPAYLNLGILFFKQNQFDKAIAAFEKAAIIDPNHAETLYSMGAAYKAKGEPDKAIACYQKATSIRPNWAEALYEMGKAHQAQNDFENAVICYEKSFAIKPGDAPGYYNMANSLRTIKRFEQAIAYYQKSIELQPDNAEAHYHQGLAYQLQEQLDEAISCYEKAVNLKPNHTDYSLAYCVLYHQLQRICAWDKLKGMADKIEYLTQKAIQTQTKTDEAPFENIARCDDPAKNFAVAKSWSEDISAKLKVESGKWKVESVKRKNNLTLNTSHITHNTHPLKLKIGYISGDFRKHPVAQLILGLFALHDRNRFKVICYSHGRNDGGIYRQKIEQDCDEFVDLQALSNIEAARRIYQDEIDILVDLTGYTMTARPEIFAMRPAPIQISYLGFPGTSGADFFDYILTDRIVSPESHARYYSEKFAYLPNCYMITDHAQPISDKHISRADAGLAEPTPAPSQEGNTFVFCCFNQNLKIDPTIFDVWMSLLRQVPDSVLWLIRENETSEKNLRQAAIARGINDQRLIFRKKIPLKDEYLACLNMADMALDTKIVNGHTTTVDALWAGVPVIALLGNHFASRVSASILTAVGLPELIACNLQEYEALALKFAQNPNELNRIRQKLAKHRLTEPLFDTPRFVKNLENIYQRISNPSDSVAELENALHLHQSGSLDQAEKIYAKILSVYPEHADALHLSGLIAYQQGRHVEAVDKIQKAIQYSPDNEMYHSNLGAAFKAQNKFEEAVSAYRRALQIEPNFAKARDNLAELCFEQGNHLKNTGKPDEAVKWYQDALNIKPGYEKAYTAMYHQFQHLCQWQPLETMNPRVDLMSKSAIENHVASPEMPLMNITRHADPALNFLVAQSWSNVIADRIPKPAIDPNAELQRAFNLHQAGQIEAAEAIYLKILDIAPNTADALHLLGLIAHSRENYDQATELIGKALEISPNSAIFHSNLGAALQGQKKNDEAVAEYQKALSLVPNYQEAKSNLDIIVKNWIDSGFSLQCQGKFAEALPLYQKAIEFVTNDGLLYLNLGICFHSTGKWDEAIAAYRKTIELNPTQPDVYMNLGLLLQNMKRSEEAIAIYQKAIEVRPENPDAYNNIGICLQNMGKTLQSIAAYQKSVELKPDNIGAYLNMGNSLRIAEKFEEAIAAYQKALEYNPDYAEAFCSMYHQLQYICDWTGIEANNKKLDALTNAALDKGQKTMETPFVSLTRVADPARNLAIAKTWSGEISAKCNVQNAKFEIQRAKFKEGKITIGYLSGDFRNHPVAHLMSGLFKLHNRQEFEIICYSYGRNDDSEYRKQIESGCDQFVDIREMDYEKAAERIYQDKVDILVEMMGFTGTDNRLEICALRPAPIQISYLGFPGSIGADFFDYIITDKIVSPPEHAPYYTEKLAYLPHCYQVNNHEQRIGDTPYRRQDFGLPQHSIVFSSFNQPYKIEPVMFDVWMRILKQIPDSVLWLLWRSQSAENNLKREAQNRGVSPDRLMFAKRLVKPEHLARQRLADLVLDTRIYNGHTTTSDALWAGVPVVALAGSHFASRVSSSILSAIGLPELITENLEDYERLVLRLASYPEELKLLRQKLAKNRLTQPLFDTPLFAKNLEKLYKEIWGAFRRLP